MRILLAVRSFYKLIWQYMGSLGIAKQTDCISASNNGITVSGQIALYRNDKAKLAGA